MNVPTDTLEDEVEPFLLRLGFLRRTSRGRVLTPAAWMHVGKTPPPDGQGTLF